MGKIIVIEGTDGSGKETQQKLLAEKVSEKGFKVGKMSFPNYDSPTGKIIGGCYLGKSYITEDILSKKYANGLFEENADTIDPYIVSLYYAADRRNSLPNLKSLIADNDVVFLDRYVASNMAHQAGRIDDTKKRNTMYDDLEKLEFGILGLPRPDLTILLYLPYSFSEQLRKNRQESLDVVEKSAEYLKKAELAYLELAKKFNYKIINCVTDDRIKTIEEINQEIMLVVEEIL